VDDQAVIGEKHRPHGQVERLRARYCESLASIRLKAMPVAASAYRGKSRQGGSGRQAVGAWTDITWRHIEQVRAALEAGADVNAVLDATQETPLYRALWQGTPEVVELLLARGADVETTLPRGWTPLWAAVRGVQAGAVDRPQWRREKVRLLLAYGADPWRPTMGGRSPGEVALWGPLADLFADLPGAPQIPAADRQRQAGADALIAAYGWADQWAIGGGSVAFVKGMAADEVIGRLGGDPAACPLVDAAGYGELAWRYLVKAPMLWAVEPVWVADVAGGTAAWQEVSWLLVREEITGPLSRGGLLACTFAGGDGTITVHVFRDGEFVRRTEPIYDPGFAGGGWGVALEEERWCRFGDRDAPAGRMAQCLALMTMLTGIQVGEVWLRDEPKRVVMVTPPVPTS
jgi:hypothetical protein